MHNHDFAQILLAILPLLLAITVHEAAHGYMARHYGDHTAALMGRLTLNPVKHIDLVGTIIVPLIIFMSSSLFGAPMIFGWAKPVPINPRHFRNPRIASRMVSVAGPLANLFMSFGWALLLIASQWVPDSFKMALELMSFMGISFNIGLFILNMLPILPLDGGRFINTFLPLKWSYQYQKTEPYGMWIILLLLITNVLEAIIKPLYQLIFIPINLLINLFM
ncbi:site-2 protease family protein [Neisseriaceae bacterium ESL0693]|nr:site-2 protease family protein [Neisseriaceae bacterium ESL0693]